MHSFFISFLIAFNLLYSQIHVEEITNNLDKPVYATSIMLDVETIFIVEQDGIIKIIKDSNLEESMLFLDIQVRVLSPFYPGDERGLLGLALDPNFKQNGYFYVNYVNKDDFSIVSRFSSIYFGNVLSKSTLSYLKFLSKISTLFFILSSIFFSSVNSD